MDSFYKMKAIVNVFENLSSCSIEYITVLCPTFHFNNYLPEIFLSAW